MRGIGANWKWAIPLGLVVSAVLAWFAIDAQLSRSLKTMDFSGAGDSRTIKGIQLELKVISWLVRSGLLSPRESEHSSAGSLAQSAECPLQKEEYDVYIAYLRGADSQTSLRILVTETVPRPTSLDYINLRLAANGRGIPPDVRHDFEARSKTSCAIEAIPDIRRLRFISKRGEEQIFKTGWEEFHRRYGKDAEIVSLSRVGFNSDRTLALLHVSSAIGPMAGGGMLYLFERKRDQWSIKTRVATWAT